MCEQKELKETRSAHTTRHYSLYTIQYTRLVSIHPIRSCIPDRRWSTNRIPPEICTSQGGRSQSMVCIRKSVVAQPSYGRIARQCACAIGRRVGAARPPSTTLLLCRSRHARASSVWRWHPQLPMRSLMASVSARAACAALAFAVSTSSYLSLICFAVRAAPSAPRFASRPPFRTASPAASARSAA